MLATDVEIITPNPKTSGGARWNYLAAWGFALERALGGNLDSLPSLGAAELAAAQAEAEAFVGELYRRVPVQDTGARAATNTFVQRGIGDVLLAWENEALLAANEMGADAFDIVRPSVSVLAEPPVALMDSIVDRKGTRAVAEAYLDFLYAPEGQDIVARNFFRPTDAATARALRRAVSADAAVHRRPGVRRLGEGASRAFRRRRRLRPAVRGRGRGAAAMTRAGRGTPSTRL